MSNTAIQNRRPLRPIVLTPGEPAGIGPDLALRLALRAQSAAVINIADPGMLAERARRLDLKLDIIELASLEAARPPRAGQLQVLPVACAAPVVAGQLDPENSTYVLQCLDRAIAACRDDHAAAMVTGPINKAVINDAGTPFSGHTEYLADKLGAPLPVMLLVADRLRVALLTTHVPLAEVAGLLSEQLITSIVDILVGDLERLFALPGARLALCGLNPHAGEQGHLGREEQLVMSPAVNALTARGVSIVGPVPADSAFTRSERERYDAIVAVYHDQGLTALKALSFGDAVNVTLGLPIVRTSVDHGTALDIAGSGNGDAASLHAAVTLAINLAANREHHAERGLA